MQYGALLVLILHYTAANLDLHISINTSHTSDKHCPHGSYVTGFKLRSHALQRAESKQHWRFGGLSGLVLVCGGAGEVEFSSPGYHDAYSTARHCPCDKAVTSARLRTAEGIINTLDMYCDNSTLTGSGQHAGMWHERTMCPRIAGKYPVQSYITSAKVQFTQGRIANLSFKCQNRGISKECETKVTPPDAAQWTPTYHFDPEHRCYPDPLLEDTGQLSPESQYSGQCRNSHNPTVPVYYRGVECGSGGYQLHYWLYYGYQRSCFISLGKHAGDWEHVRLNFVLCGNQYCIDSVTYHQHRGWFTVPYVEHPESTVHVWVAQIGHSSFPTSCSKTGDRHEKCVGGCLYFDDYHRAGGVTWTPHNVHPDPLSATVECESQSCEGQSCIRNEWFHG